MHQIHTFTPGHMDPKPLTLPRLDGRQTPHSPGSLAQLSRALQRENRLDEALEVAESAVCRFPCSEAAQLRLADVLIKFDRLSDAEMALATAARLQTKGPEVRLTLARLRHQQSRFREAVEIAESTLREFPGSKQAQNLVNRFRAIHAAFNSVWSAEDLARAQSILARVFGIAEENGVRLYLDAGTLLGYVRQGGILPWDDDLDLSTVDGAKVEALKPRFVEAGLSHIDLGEKDYIKVFDPSYAPLSWEQYHYSWPAVDIFIFNQQDDCCVSEYKQGYRMLGNPYHPGSRVRLEGVPCWLPQRPLDILDTYYANWRTVEASGRWCHRTETYKTGYSRPIRTDAAGRKL